MKETLNVPPIVPEGLRDRFLETYNNNIEIYGEPFIEGEFSRDLMEYKWAVMDSGMELQGKFFDSPLEQVFFNWCRYCSSTINHWGNSKGGKDYENRPYKWGVFIQPKIEVLYLRDTFRVDGAFFKYKSSGDFLETFRLFCFVELDGKSYHDSDDSFENDRRRDNYLGATFGIPVLRFSYKALYKDLSECAVLVGETMRATEGISLKYFPNEQKDLYKALEEEKYFLPPEDWWACLEGKDE